MENSMQKMLGKQFLITAFIEQRLQIVNFIKEGYDLDKPILINNRFLHFTAHVYYRSIIVDLYALFGPANSNNKNSFFYIKKSFQNVIKPGSSEIVQDWINKSEEDIKVIKTLRNKQIAHYDFNEKESISLNFDTLFRLNNLYHLAQKIIGYYGHAFINENIKIGYVFGHRHQNIDSLERLIAKAART